MTRSLPRQPADAGRDAERYGGRDARRHADLDAAQHLFAREGYQSTSLRAITKKAGANIAAINYHFGSKEELLKFVIERHLSPLNQMRKERLEKAKEKAKHEEKVQKVDASSCYVGL